MLVLCKTSCNRQGQMEHSLVATERHRSGAINALYGTLWMLCMHHEQVWQFCWGITKYHAISGLMCCNEIPDGGEVVVVVENCPSPVEWPIGISHGPSEEMIRTVVCASALHQFHLPHRKDHCRDWAACGLLIKTPSHRHTEPQFHSVSYPPAYY